MKINVFYSKNHWRWRIISRNGQNEGTAGQFYSSRSSAVRAGRAKSKQLRCKIVIDPIPK